MTDLADYDLEQGEGTRPDFPRPTRLTGVWAFAGLLVAVALIAAYFALRDRSSVAPATAKVPAPVEATENKVKPLGSVADAIDVPPLGESDPLVRELVRALSSHPRIAAWLATPNLIRNFTVVVHNVADGRTPSPHLAVLRPLSKFGVIERGGTYVDPKSYSRYDAIADAVASVDPADGARLYATLKPRIEEAHRELGFPDASFDRTLERAIVTLLETPVVDGPISVEPPQKGIGYAYADRRLEALSGAQKQLLRMGPRNVRIIKDALRQIAISLGIPAQKLPATR